MTSAECVCVCLYRGIVNISIDDLPVQYSLTDLGDGVQFSCCLLGTESLDVIQTIFMFENVNRIKKKKNPFLVLRFPV